ncbi:hypothetical protein SIN8267_02262 [Sinobacterium norvegicum]|uniref:Chlorhexidine efflux transporter domain-containing protein n=1 Tax=Sinobacterium norvegicum TaxID=1641715 RepID=A0ABN8EIG9_9GAMM|nr:PACE efflux transporter [Sinobacterium norvegicum]CAH0992146.1 hypothetical protein SIN8267_02262 [Sinobacterium norvegicum]
MSTQSMSVKERIFHSVLFEVLALLIVIPISTLVLTEETATMTVVAVAMALSAMVWNYIYNLGFDALFGHERILRGLALRILHGVVFELGLLLATVPLIMVLMDLAFWPALLIDAGLVVFFLVYAIVYNYCYDHIRFKWVSKNATQQAN